MAVNQKEIERSFCALVVEASTVWATKPDAAPTTRFLASVLVSAQFDLPWNNSRLVLPCGDRPIQTDRGCVDRSVFIGSEDGRWALEVWRLRQGYK